MEEKSKINLKELVGKGIIYSLPEFKNNNSMYQTKEGRLIGVADDESYILIIDKLTLTIQKWSPNIAKIIAETYIDNDLTFGNTNCIHTYLDNGRYESIDYGITYKQVPLATELAQNYI